eukprot:CAMPEP_0202420232 /NCGR_PEP_ID=MMETSP1128-20130828/49713_1 /ASSEMBLY_ACC=CAM_ASM_000463 /TAXON_ID=3047 /ORGANISM="Dunaliella tertiolecta, Strain CCMP1320" /LENGTH=67 /DNA_ID=CAMNT_0049028209 /DNA_START=90 /DNA_END=294 /DNA_ORIENTATION=-
MTLRPNNPSKNDAEADEFSQDIEQEIGSEHQQPLTTKKQKALVEALLCALPLTLRLNNLIENQCRGR